MFAMNLRFCYVVFNSHIFNATARFNGKNCVSYKNITRTFLVVYLKTVVKTVELTWVVYHVAEPNRRWIGLAICD
jgi:hypothetical protein